LDLKGVSLDSFRKTGKQILGNAEGMVQGEGREGKADGWRQGRKKETRDGSNRVGKGSRDERGRDGMVT
jgi:hypothetical protein